VEKINTDELLKLWDKLLANENLVKIEDEID
jgi:hypothetical protein